MVDGGSTDETLKILGKYKHLKWVSEPDKGQADAMNKGFNISEGEIIVYLNADDYFFPGAFAAVIERFNKGAKFVVGNVLVKSPRLDTEFVNTPRTTLMGMLRHWEPNAFSHNPVGYFYLREVQKACPFNADNYASMDLEFLLDAASKYDFVKVEKTLGCFEDGKDTKTGQTQARLDYWQPKTFPYIDKYLDTFTVEERIKYGADRRAGYAELQKQTNAMNKDSLVLLPAEKIPKISVIIPTYNCAKYLARAIDSVLSQKLLNLEIIVIDDASTDKTDTVLKKYSKNKQIRIIKNKENIRQGASRNRGIDLATGKYLFFLDADDWLEAGILQRLASISEEYDTEIVSCGVSQVSETGETKEFHAYDFACSGGIEAIHNFTEYRIGSIVWDKLYLLKFIKDNNLKFIPNYYHEDVIFTMEAINIVNKFVSVSDIGCSYFQRSDSTINSKQTKLHLESYASLYFDIESYIDKITGLSAAEIAIMRKRLLESHAYNTVWPGLVRYSKTHTKSEWEKDCQEAYFKVMGAAGGVLADILIRSIEYVDALTSVFELSEANLSFSQKELRISQEKLSDVYSSRSWRLGRSLVKILTQLVPPGSLRRRLGNGATWLVKLMGRYLVSVKHFLEILFFKIKPKKIRIVNKKSNKIVYIGHSYHNKTKSTTFLIDYLKGFYDVDLVLDDSWQGKPFPDLSFIDESYLGVIFFQNLPDKEVISSIKNDNLIFFPMYDAVYWGGYAYWRSLRHMKIFNFSSTLHNKLSRWGFETKYVQYFPKPDKYIGGAKREVFFWQRLSKISIKEIAQIFAKSRVNIHIHRALDPGQEYTKPTKEEEKNLGVTYSDWFETREEMQTVIKQKGIYVAPREYEGIGMSFLEAMAMGKAVVAVNNPTMNEYIVDGRTGYLFDLASPKSIDLKDLEKVQKNTYKYMCDGYAKWETDKHKIIDFIERGPNIDNSKKVASLAAIIQKKQIISIVTPSFNQAIYIEDTICSILSQAGDFYLDYVIVDGNSSDNSLQVIKKYEKLLQANCYIKMINGHQFYINKKKDFKFNKCLGVSYRYISENDSGHGDALNKGFKLTFGNIMAWLNSDDMYHRGAFKNVVGVFSEYGDISWITGLTTYWDGDGNLTGTNTVYKNIYDFLREDFGWIQQESTFWRRTLWEKSGSFINEDYRFMVDGELWCRFFLHDKLWNVATRLGGYRMHDSNRASANINEINKEMKKAISVMRNSADKKTVEISKAIMSKDKNISNLSKSDINAVNYLSLIHI